MTDNSLKPLLQEAVNSFLKAQEKEKTVTLRMALSEIKKEEIDKKTDLNDQEVISILQRMIKQRKDSISCSNNTLF